MKIQVTIEAKPDTPMGIPNGKTIFHVMAVNPWKNPDAVKLLGSGCVLGRDYTRELAIRDFVRRARADGGSITFVDLEIL